MATDVRPIAYPLAQAAKMLGKSRRTLKRLYDAGEMPGKPLGRDLMVPTAWVDAYGEWPTEAAS